MPTNLSLETANFTATKLADSQQQSSSNRIANVVTVVFFYDDLGLHMALGATVYVFDIQLADSDRNVYETLALRVARHPSESEEYLITRVLAYCLEFQEGISFSSGGLSNPDEPALAVRDLTGVLHTWIDIGAPEAARLHKASKAAKRVAVYVHKDIDALFSRIRNERIHRIETIEFFAMDRNFIAALTPKLARRMEFSLSITDRNLYLTLGDDTLSGNVELRTAE
jgi:uncharacterized protein YaeQ